jgi:ligand-binding sensor domain-containing protein
MGRRDRWEAAIGRDWGNRTVRVVRVTRVLVAAIAVHCGIAASQQVSSQWSELAELGFRHQTEEQGLPNPIVNAIAEDSNGFIWAGTEGGLARWDGYRFRSYPADTGQSDSLPDSYITTLHTDSLGRFWIGTASGGLALYDSARDQFIAYRAGPHGLSHGYVWSIADDGRGGLWIATDAGLDHLASDLKTFTKATHDPADPHSLPDNHVQVLLRDPDGTIWVGTRTGLARFDGGRTFTPVPASSGAGSEPSVSALFYDKSRRLWIGTDQGVYVIDSGRSAAQAAVADHDQISAIAPGLEGTILAATLHGGILVIDETSHLVRHIHHEQTVPETLLHEQVRALLRDRAGTIWAGTLRGLDRCMNCDSSITTVVGSLARSSAGGAIDIYSVLAAQDDSIWLGLGAGEVDVVDPTRGSIAATKISPSQPVSGTSTDNVYALTEMSGNVYIGAGRGLYVSPSGDRSHRIRPLQLPGAQLGIGVRALVNDGQSVWLGTGGDGIWAFAPVASGWRVTQRIGSAQLSDGRVVDMTRSPAGDLWVGTLNGLNERDSGTGRLKQYPAAARDAPSLSSGFVSSLLFDRRGRLWIGTLGGGIDITSAPADAAGSRLIHLGVKEGLPNANVDKLLLDAKGDVWVSTDNGIAQVDAEGLTVRALSPADGLVITNYWLNSGAVTRSGELLFGGAGGLTVVAPSAARAWRYDPPIVVTELRVGGRRLSIGGFNADHEIAPVTISPHANSLWVEFSALDLTAPERNRYAYQLEGYDSAWVEADSSHRVAAYTNLPPGNYRLRLRGSNRTGVWSTHTLAIPFIVQPAWYQTGWFRTLAVLMLVGAVVLLVRMRTAFLRARRRELERQVVLQTEQLRERERQLEQLVIWINRTGKPPDAAL